ncbi:helix-turn-helix domain-containing protein [Chitinilyticum aquatile]|uniref:helix-turn-helix domain-containing protein n=1 Tax=Chitinilyticum aquatile TaxID=362520 RepID=UPI00041CB8BC|nr:helix-turn-helix domain-containing protein [Chitinilyticum aquatile]
MEPLDHRVARVIHLTNFIESRLSAEMSLQDMADIACYSPYHLERVVGDVTGFTPVDYLRQRRMLCACERVRHETTSLLQIAHEVGFGSNASFSRAFRRQFGFSPRDWRQGAWRDCLKQNNRRWHSFFKASDSETWLKNWHAWWETLQANRYDVGAKVQLRQLSATPVWYLRHFGVRNGEALMSTNSQLTALLKQQGHADAHTSWIDVWWSDSAFAQPIDFISERCMVAQGPPPPGLAGRLLPGGCYASLDFEGSHVHTAWIYEDWLEKQTFWTADATRPVMALRQFTDEQLTGGTYLVPLRQR